MTRIREFDMSDASFERIRRFVSEKTGIVLTEAKKDMVYGRLSKRIRKGRFNTFDEFCDALEAGDEEEQEFMINAITTNLTAFFREKHHFDFLANTVIPELIIKNRISKRIRIWSAGCSTGEEPYSIAMILKQSIPNIEQWDIKILATDLDANVVAHGKAGIYRADRITGIEERYIKKWFKYGKGDNADSVKVSPELQSLITFKRLNLLHEWPMRGPFDVIFCRNVVIYFDKDTQKLLFDRYADILAAEAHLFIGHSESLYKVTTRFDNLGHTIYRKNS
ncbi:MAG: protein-glutamate O-methyltransferase CheR [Gammaproteobacteria bacterium]|nr:protein-glutamate O-methyltransferase CheR [Gammaproteobacteria bacterium]